MKVEVKEKARDGSGRKLEKSYVEEEHWEQLTTADNVERDGLGRKRKEIEKNKQENPGLSWT